MTQIFYKNKVKTWTDGSLTNVLWKNFLEPMETQVFLEEEGTATWVATQSSASPSSSKPLPFPPPLLLSGLSLHFNLELPTFQAQISPIPLHKALEADLHCFPGTPNSLSRVCQGALLLPSCTVHCCVWNFAYIFSIFLTARRSVLGIGRRSHSALS